MTLLPRGELTSDLSEKYKSCTETKVLTHPEDRFFSHQPPYKYEGRIKQKSFILTVFTAGLYVILLPVLGRLLLKCDRLEITSYPVKM